MIGIYGGSFDPIHYGHLRAAWECYEQLQLDKVVFVPSKNHPTKQPAYATVAQRLHMLNLAIADNNKFEINDFELQQDTKTYTIDTLIALQQIYDNHTLAFIVGTDIFAKFDTWHRWQELINYSHIIVVSRPGHTFNPSKTLAEYIAQHQCDNITKLTESDRNKIIFVPIALLDIASSEIRRQLQQGCNPNYLLPTKVLNYIKQQYIY